MPKGSNSNKLTSAGQQGVTIASTTDALDGVAFPDTVPFSRRSSRPVEPYSEPVYRKPTVFHRSGTLTGGSTGQTSADTTAVPTVAPTWAGYIANSGSVAGGSTTFQLETVGDWGTPPSATGSLYLICDQTAANVEVVTVSAAPSGGPTGNPSTAAPWTMTIASAGTLAHSHNQYTRVVCLGTTQSSALNMGGVTNGLCSAMMGGPGCKSIRFKCYAVSGGTSANNAHFQLYVWDDLVGLLVPAASLLGVLGVLSTTQSGMIDVDVKGDFFAVGIADMITATGNQCYVTASESWS